MENLTRIIHGKIWMSFLVKRTLKLFENDILEIHIYANKLILKKSNQQFDYTFTLKDLLFPYMLRLRCGYLFNNLCEILLNEKKR